MVITKGLILWGTQMSVQNVIPIQLPVVTLDQRSGLTGWRTLLKLKDPLHTCLGHMKMLCIGEAQTSQ